MSTSHTPCHRNNYPTDLYQTEFRLVKAIALATKLKISLDQVLQMLEIQEHERTNNIAIEDGNARDDHAGSYAGLAQVLQQIADDRNECLYEIVRYVMEEVKAHA